MVGKRTRIKTMVADGIKMCCFIIYSTTQQLSIPNMAGCTSINDVPKDVLEFLINNHCPELGLAAHKFAEHMTLPTKATALYIERMLFLRSFGNKLCNMIDQCLTPGNKLALGDNTGLYFKINHYRPRHEISTFQITIHAKEEGNRNIDLHYTARSGHGGFYTADRKINDDMTKSYVYSAVFRLLTMFYMDIFIPTKLPNVYGFNEYFEEIYSYNERYIATVYTVDGTVDGRADANNHATFVFGEPSKKGGSKSKKQANKKAVPSKNKKAPTRRTSKTKAAKNVVVKNKKHVRT